MATRAELKDQTHDAILQAAMTAYSESGSRAGLIGIGKRVGVSHSTVLYHFGSAHGLQQAVLNERDRLFLAYSFPDGEWKHGPVEGLRNIRAVAQFAIDHPELARLFAVLEAENASPDQPLHDYFAQRRAALHDGFVATMKAAIELGELPDRTDLGQRADEIIAFQTGASIMWAYDTDGVDLLRLYDDYLEGLITALGLP